MRARRQKAEGPPPHLGAFLKWWLASPIMAQRKGPPPRRGGPVFLALVSERSALSAVLDGQSVNHETETDLVDGVTNVVDDVHVEVEKPLVPLSATEVSGSAM